MAKKQPSASPATAKYRGKLGPESFEPVPEVKLILEKKKRGRPTLYQESFCDRIIELMGRGWSISAVCAEIGVSRDMIWEWDKKYPDCSWALLTGKELSQKWWETLAMHVAQGTVGEGRTPNPGMIMFMMARRFPDYYQKKEAALESEASGNRADVIRTLSKEERLALIEKYQKIILDLNNGEKLKKPEKKPPEFEG